MKQRPTTQEAEAYRLMAQEILTPDQVAELLQVKRSWIFEKTRKRCPTPLPCLRIGRFLRFRLRDIEEWLETTKGVAA